MAVVERVLKQLRDGDHTPIALLSCVFVLPHYPWRPVVNLWTSV